MDVNIFNFFISNKYLALLMAPTPLGAWSVINISKNYCESKFPGKIQSK